MPNDVYTRYRCFINADEFKKAVLTNQPERIEIGPVYSAPPSMNKTLKTSGRFVPRERELIFDIDMDEYNEIRTCCSAKTVCKK
jgi:DNA primase small subunit